MKSCKTGKRVFTSKRRAMRFCRGARFHGTSVRSYRCPSCDGWHITTREYYDPTEAGYYGEPATREELRTGLERFNELV